jgi:glycosyltransferase involved in cell wall biosynthesis
MEASSRADLHVHSEVSRVSAEWFLRKIDCPECSTPPKTLYRLARQRGMDFVTITDHDSIDGALRIKDLPGTFISEEVSTRFPEDDARLHVVALNITPEQHDEIQKHRHNVYHLVDYFQRESILHFLAHPVYASGGRLTVDHVEKALLLFKTFEAINGQHTSPESLIFRDIVAALTEERIEELSRRHGIDPVGERPWEKGWTGGSDDHSMLCIAATYTETDRVDSLDEFLEEIRRGKGRGAGEPAASLKLAHAIYSGAYNYYRLRFGGRDAEKSFVGRFFQRLLEGKSSSKKWWRPLRKLYPVARRVVRKVHLRDSNPVAAAFKEEVMAFLEENRSLRRRLFGIEGSPPNQIAMFRLASEVSSRLIHRYVRRMEKDVREADLLDLAQAIAAVATIHGFLFPYYFSFMHFHRDKNLIRDLRGRFDMPLRVEDQRLCLFTDTLLEINGVAHTIRTMGGIATEKKRHFRVASSLSEDAEVPPYADQYPAIASFDLPEYPELKLNFPSFLDVLHSVETQRFDAVHISTPGIMGLIGLAVGRMMKVPVVGTYHTDIPRYAATLTGDDHIGELAWKYIRWFCDRLDILIVPSHATARYLAGQGLDPDRMRVLIRGVDSGRFHPGKRDPSVWERIDLDGGPKLLYVGRVSKEKNIDVLVKAFDQVRERIPEARLVIVGDGPYRQELEAANADSSVRFPGYTRGEDLARLYASSDLFVFPSRTDTLGNVVMEAQASGLPAVVSDEGGPQELVETGTTGVVTSCLDPDELARELVALLQNPDRMRNMGSAGRERMVGRTPESFFDAFWKLHLDLVSPEPTETAPPG